MQNRECCIEALIDFNFRTRRNVPPPIAVASVGKQGEDVSGLVEKGGKIGVHGDICKGCTRGK